MAWRQMAAEGISPQKDFKSLSFAGTHDAVVYAVGTHKADAGTVRTGTLERMAAQGKIDLSQFRILNINAAAGQSTGMKSSPRRYPEWPLARLSPAPDKLSGKVAQALFLMKESPLIPKKAMKVFLFYREGVFVAFFVHDLYQRMVTGSLVNLKATFNIYSWL